MYLPLGELTWRRARAEPFTPREWHKESGQRTRLLRSRSAHTLTPLMRPREKPEAERRRGYANPAEHHRSSTPTARAPTIVSPLPAREISRVTHVIEVGCVACSLVYPLSLMFQGHLLNFRGCVLGFPNGPFDKWRRTN